MKSHPTTSPMNRTSFAGKYLHYLIADAPESWDVRAQGDDVDFRTSGQLREERSIGKARKFMSGLFLPATKLTDLSISV